MKALWVLFTLAMIVAYALHPRPVVKIQDRFPAAQQGR
jgi:hypothetical protein